MIAHICSIRRRGYYLFYRSSWCGVDLRAATIQEQHLLIPVVAREQSVEEWSIDTTELGDPGPFAHLEEGYNLF